MPIITTADGRKIDTKDLRIIPGFKKYKISEDGDVWSRTKRRLLKEYEDKRGYYKYYLVDDEGKNTTRNFETLIELAFPELAVPKQKKVGTKPPTYLSKSDWKEIPGFPKFQLHPTGAIRTTLQRKKMQTKINSLTGKPYFSMVGAEGTWAVSIEDLLDITFPETQIEEKVAA